MANIWKKDDSHFEQPNRNIMDLSFQNNLTLDFGYLYPVVVQPTIPGDSYEFKPTFALNFESMVFPVQTRMRSYLHFFKVRNRNLWKDWEDFIGKNKQGLEVPYIDESVTKARTGKLLDYLGVPTTIVGSYGTTSESETTTVEISGYDALEMDIDYTVSGSADTVSSIQSLMTNTINGSSVSDLMRSTSATARNRIYFYPVDLVDNALSLELSYVFNVGVAQNNADLTTVPVSTSAVRPTPFEDNYPGNYIYLVGVSSTGVMTVLNKAIVNSADSISVVVPSTRYDRYYIAQLNTVGVYLSDEPQYVPWYAQPLSYSYKCTYGITDVRDIDDTNSPYWRSNDTRGKDTIKLRALRPRAYESIYNAIYRSAENNPYKINGVEEYNKYIPTLDGGLDPNKYELRRRNWEDDFLTTALPMPQAGIAPLVGLTGTAGAATVTIANSDGETVVANAQVDEDGNITSLTTEASSNLASSLLDTVTYGISINDLRNVNAFQRWLEAKARGGYKYKDQIETLFGVTVRYDTLDMPEFIGGMSLDVFVNQITQTVNVSPSSPLGDIAGQASCIGSGETIHEYCDEHGYIIGILSVVPVPNYSQLLDKDWFKSDALDYYFPQFGHIGMQPITYKEVCPVQAFQESTEIDNVLEDTFGYQRAWYDYLARTDEVHGHFRTTLRDFVMNRTFDVKPELSESFLLVDNEQLNDVFAITDNSVPKIRGQIYFDIKAKRPIPLYGIPKLE